MSSRGGRRSISGKFIATDLLFYINTVTVIKTLRDNLAKGRSALFTGSLVSNVTTVIVTSDLKVKMLLSTNLVLICRNKVALFTGILTPLLASSMVGRVAYINSLLVINLTLGVLGLAGLGVVGCTPTIFFPVLFKCFVWQRGRSSPRQASFLVGSSITIVVNDGRDRQGKSEAVYKHCTLRTAGDRL